MPHLPVLMAAVPWDVPPGIVALVSLLVTAIIVPLVTWGWKRFENRSRSRGRLRISASLRRRDPYSAEVMAVLEDTRERLGVTFVHIQRMSEPVPLDDIDSHLLTATVLNTDYTASAVPLTSRFLYDFDGPLGIYRAAADAMHRFGYCHIPDIARAIEESETVTAAIVPMQRMGIRGVFHVPLRDTEGRMTGTVMSYNFSPKRMTDDEKEIMFETARKLERLFPWCD